MREIFLIRHGETEWNVAKRMQGQSDSPLTALGRDQAASVGRLLGKALEGRPVPLFQASPLKRTRDTAAIIAEHAGLGAPVLEPRLQEIAFGRWEGFTRAEIEAKWPGSLDGMRELDWSLHSPDGETYDMISARVQSWLDALDGPVIAVSHGMTGRFVRGLHLGLSYEEVLQLPTPQDLIWHLTEGGIQAIGP
jgi:broad specificity phosphatase PhoE